MMFMDIDVKTFLIRPTMDKKPFCQLTDVSDRRSVSIDHDLGQKLAHKRKRTVVVLTIIVTTNVNIFR